MPDKYAALGCSINYKSSVKQILCMCKYLDLLYENIEINSLEQDDNGNINNKHISITINKVKWQCNKPNHYELDYSITVCVCKFSKTSISKSSIPILTSRFIIKGQSQVKLKCN